MVCIIDNKKKHSKINLFRSIKIKKFTVDAASFSYIDAHFVTPKRLIRLLRKKKIHRVLLTENISDMVLDELVRYRIEIADKSCIQVSKASMAAIIFLKQRIKKGVKTVVTIIDNDFNTDTQRLISDLSNYTPYIAVVTENVNRFYYLSTHIYSATGIAIILQKKEQFESGVNLIIYVNKKAPEVLTCPAIELSQDGVQCFHFQPAYAYKKQLLELAQTLSVSVDLVVMALEKNIVECCNVLYE